MTADQKVERAATKLQRLANQLAGEGGLKAKLAQPSLSPLSEPPQNVEVIRKPRKEKPVVEDDTDEA